MKNHLDRVLIAIGEEYKGLVLRDARHYLEVSIGGRAKEMGFSNLEKQFECACAVVPIRHPVEGMKVRIDGRTFVDYEQFESGIAVPGYVAKESGLPHEPFIPKESLILNFA